MRLRPVAVAATLSALALGAAPADAALPVVRDAVTVTGKAGATVRFRLEGVLRMAPDITRLNDPITRVSVSGGPFGGIALYRQGFPIYYAVHATPQWACGAARCDAGKVKLFDVQAPGGFDDTRNLPTGEYLAVLLGAPGATVTATIATEGRRVRTVLRAQPGGTPVVEHTAATAPAGAQQVAGGAFTTSEGRRGIVGVIQVAVLEDWSAMDAYPASGATNDPRGACAASPAPSFAGGGLPEPSLVWTQSSAAFVTGGGIPCAAWAGTARAVTATQRGLAFFVRLP